MLIDLTKRGFAKGEFVDRYGKKCSIQESSIATEDCIWLGCNEGDHTDGQCLARMHLTKEMAAELIPLLQYFVEKGRLPLPENNKLGVAEEKITPPPLPPTDQSTCSCSGVFQFRNFVATSSGVDPIAGPYFSTMPYICTKCGRTDLPPSKFNDTCTRCSNVERGLEEEISVVSG